MSVSKKKKRSKRDQGLIKKIFGSLGFIFAILFIVLGLFVVLVFGLALVFNTKFYPQTKVAGVEVSSLSPQEAFEKIQAKVIDYQKQEILVACGEKKTKVKVSDFKVDFKVEETLSQLFNLGHPKNFKEVIWQFPQIVRLLILRYQMPILIEIGDQDKIQSLQSNISNLPRSAEYFLENNELKIRKEEEGLGVSRDVLNQALVSTFSLLRDELLLTPQVLTPEISAADLENLKPKVEEILSYAPLELRYQGETKASLSKEDLLSLLGFSVEKRALQKVISFKVNEQTKEKIYTKIKEQVDEPGKNVRLEFQGSQLVVLEKEQYGLYLNEDDLEAKLESFFVKPVDSIDLSLSKQLPNVHSANYSQFDFGDLLGKGESTFYGSSANRIHNIKNGASKLHGFVIDKGATFSLGEALGEISAETGYLPELVIKNKRTVPEYGGGLCQVATTMFRAALYSGLPITERHNHAYRVGYYEPPIGMDATIYYPQVDLKFKNDTLGPILIQTAVKGYKITFYFYGQSDGRKAVVSKPNAYNFTAPPEPVYIDDQNLPEGELIYEEKSHWGADAYFVYKVYRQGELIYEKKFYSHYKAWPAIIRRGTKKE